MVGCGDARLHVSSWGWADKDGQPALRDDAVFRLWSVRLQGERLAMLLLPVDQDSRAAFLAAYRLFPDD